jgi:succinate dehydrogenase / fumarate reductase, cytochrome b subunit
VPAPAIARLHSATGVVPLFAFLLFHLWEVSAATAGRERFALRMTGTGASSLALAAEVAVVLLPLAVHVALGIVRLRRARSEPHAGYAEPGMRRLQWLTGGLTLAFLGVHLAHTWVVKVGGADAYGLYQRLHDDLPQPLYLGAYAVGLTALCMHVAQGLPAAAVTWSLTTTARGRRLWRVGASVLAAALWLMAVNATSHFVTGRALLYQEEPFIDSRPARTTLGP